MSANLEKSAQLASTMFGVVIVSALLGMGGTWAYENRETITENGEEWLYRLPRPHLWSQPAHVKTHRNDPIVQAIQSPSVEFSRSFPKFDTPAIPPVKFYVPPQGIPFNPPVYVPDQYGGFR